MTTNSHESVGRAERYARHVAELCEAFHVLIHPAPPAAPHDAISGAVRLSAPVKAMLDNMGIQNDGTLDYIRIVPVIDETTYAVALHELGHILAPLGRVNRECSKQMLVTGWPVNLRDVHLKLESERAAWEWAHHNALEWTPPMDEVERYAIGTYERFERRFTGGHTPMIDVKAEMERRRRVAAARPTGADPLARLKRRIP